MVNLQALNENAIICGLKFFFLGKQKQKTAQNVTSQNKK
jgi:hypothetical protein